MGSVTVVELKKDDCVAFRVKTGGHLIHDVTEEDYKSHFKQHTFGNDGNKLGVLIKDVNNEIGMVTLDHNGLIIEAKQSELEAVTYNDKAHASWTNVKMAERIHAAITYFRDLTEEITEKQAETYCKGLNTLYDSIKNCEAHPHAEEELRVMAREAWNVYQLADNDQLGFYGQLDKGDNSTFHWIGKVNDCDDYPVFLRCPIKEGKRAISTLQRCENTFTEEGENVKKERRLWNMNNYLCMVGKQNGYPYDEYLENQKQKEQERKQKKMEEQQARNDEKDLRRLASGAKKLPRNLSVKTGLPKNHEYQYTNNNGDNISISLSNISGLNPIELESLPCTPRTPRTPGSDIDSGESTLSGNIMMNDMAMDKFT